MKIIDLLNKIANGEDVPKYVSYKKQIYIWNTNHYYNIEKNECLLEVINMAWELNAGVEIMEDEKTPKKIEKIHVISTNSNDNAMEIIKKINEIIDVVNASNSK